MIKTLVLPKTLEELSITIGDAYPIDDWSGAVCMLLVEELLVFIKRSDSMPSHKGQMGFMGGHKHNGEIEPVVTALRELKEETNINSELVRVVGLVEPVYTANKKLVVPVVCEFTGSQKDFFKDLKANEEWNEMILTPFNYIAESKNWQVAKVEDKSERLIGFCPLKTPGSVIYPPSTAAEFLLWGASAKMVWNLFNCHK